MKKLVSLLLAALLLAAPVSVLAAEADYADLVTDAFTFSYDDEWGEYGFAVPKINRDGDGIQAVNDAIWHEMYENRLDGEYGVLASAAQGWSTEPYEISYDWHVNGDVLSLWTLAVYSGDNYYYDVYNVSLSVGRRITASELLSVLGIQEDAFYGQVRQILSDTFESQCAVFQEDELKDEQRAGNNSEANVRAVQPYLAENGDLCMVATIYTLAGSGRSAQMFTVMTRDQLPESISSAELPAEIPIDERLTYFLEHCDSQYFTREDIEGFDADMCLYARNGVYARSGRIFQLEKLQQFFAQFAWYHAEITPDLFDESMLNDYQKQNAALVLTYEVEHGYN